MVRSAHSPPIDRPCSGAAEKKTSARAPQPARVRPSDSSYGLEQYEALRRQALDAPASGRSGLGLALFLDRGMGAWWAALSALEPRPPQPTAPGREHSVSPVPAPHRAELVAVLAGMVMACSAEVRL